MNTPHPEDYYQISFSPTFTWTLQASPEAREWLHHFAMVMGLEKKTTKKEATYLLALIA
jgi:hypothetical protein